MSGSRILVRNTTERLRADIDSGRTGDKVAGSDPAVAPLGADDEAAGRPPKAVARVRMIEIGSRHETREHRGLGHAWVLVAFTVLLAVAIAIWAAAIHANISGAGARAATYGVAMRL